MEAQQAALKAKTVVDGFNIIGCDAYNVGAKDFANGLDFFKELQDSAQFPFISANIIDKESGELVFDPYVILERGVLKFGVIGLATVLPSYVSQYDLRDYIEAGKQYLAELDKNTDYQIVLLNGTKNDAEEAKNAFQSAEFLFLSRDIGRPRRNLKSDTPGPLIIQLGKQGRNLAILELNVTNADSSLIDVSTLKNKSKLLTRRLENLGRRNPSVPLEELYKDNLKTLEHIKRMKSDLESVQNYLSKVDNTLEFTFIPMAKNVKDDPVLLAMVNETLEACKKLASTVKESTSVSKTDKSSIIPPKPHSKKPMKKTK